MNPSLQQLVAALLWSRTDSSTPGSRTPLDSNYGVCDFEEASLNELYWRFQAFVDKAEAEITKLKGSDWSSIDDFYTGSATGGFYLEYDYIMTVNGHCCGYWEKCGWEPEVGKILSDLVRQEKGIHCFTDHVDHGQDGRVYIEFC